MNRISIPALVAATALWLSAGGASSAAAAATVHENAVGSVYTMTNAATGNDVVIFDRDGDGTLTLVGSVPTGGLGSGGGLDPLASQGSLILTRDNAWLLAVNAGSNEISVFQVSRGGLELVETVPSGGEYPTSIAVFHDLVYVLNAGGAPNLTGFSLNHKGHLAPIASSTRALAAALYSQIGFDPQGRTIVVADRSNSALVVYPIGDNGTPAAAPILSPSYGLGPFAFVFSGPRTLLVAEVGSNAVSSYSLQPDGTLALVTPSVPNGQAATCWIVDAKNRFAITANPGAQSLSSFREQPGSGELALLAGVAGTGTAPLDLGVSENGRFIYALDPVRGGIDAFALAADGSLANLGGVTVGLPLFAQGLAVR